MNRPDIRCEWIDDGWDESVPGLREFDFVTYDDEGEEIARHRSPEPAEYVPPELEEQASAETRAEMDDLAARRSEVLGRPVRVIGFTSSGDMQVEDGDMVDGELRFEPVARVQLTPSPAPRLAHFIAPVVRASDTLRRVARPRTVARPRERRRARASSSASRDGPGESDLDPPPRSRLAQWIGRLLRRGA